MNDFLIKNLDEAKSFFNKLDSYFAYNTSGTYAEEIFEYYKREENYSYIDTQDNNYKAFFLALSSPQPDFLNLILNSDKIKEKSCSLKDISERFFNLSSFNIKNVKLVIDAFEDKNKKYIFYDYTSESKKEFIRASINYFFTSNALNSIKNEDYLFNFFKKHKIKVYQNEHNLISLALYCDQVKILNRIIDNAHTKEDKAKIVYFDMSKLPFQVNAETKDFMAFKKKEYEGHIAYEELNAELNNSNSIEKDKKLKV